MTIKSLGRRKALQHSGKLILGASSLILFQNVLSGCGETTSSGLNQDGDTSDTTNGGTCSSEIPSETAGPYPGHDDSALNCLRLSGIQRSNIVSSLNAGSYTGTATATGVALTLNLTLTNADTCTPLSGYAIYLWHCDRNGKYSMYSSGITNETYLRGVQATNSSGVVTFQTIFPGCYDGRMPHMHFEIFPTLASAVDNGNSVKTSQLGFPTSVCDAVYNLSTYTTSKANFANISFATDNVFSDGTSLQIASVSGNTTSGYTANLIMGI